MKAFHSDTPKIRENDPNDGLIAALLAIAMVLTEILFLLFVLKPNRNNDSNTK
jgi:hypothetical protein